MKNMIVTAAMFVVTIAFNTTTVAADYSWYTALDLGQTHFGGDSVQTQIPVTWRGTTSDGSGAYRLTGGYQFSPNWGLEAGYLDLGHMEVQGFKQTTSIPQPDGSIAFKARAEVKGWSVAGTGTYPFDDEWSVYGRIGLLDGQTRYTRDNVGGNVRPHIAATDTTSILTYGVGVAWSFDPRWSLHLGWDSYRHLGDSNTTGRYDIGLLAVGIGYRFGGAR